MKESINPIADMEYHLRAMGIADRANYRIIATDNRIFTDGVIVAKPDYVLLHRSGAGVIVSYKSRQFNGKVSEYERVQLHAEMMAVRRELSIDLVTHPEEPSMQLAIFYADTTLMGVDLDEGLEDSLYSTTFDAISQLHRLGIYSNDRETIEGSKLARYCVDPWFEDEAFNKPAEAKAGTYIHRAIQANPGTAFRPLH